MLVTIVLGVTFVWIAAMNWRVWFIRTYQGSRASWLPLAGGACGVTACLIEPSGTIAGIWWLPLVLDYGSGPGLLQAAFFHLRGVR
ncbi:MAG TPA: hypothetical protein VGF48_05450 [Thermoanaerobaculia bacterium]|jgi:hypothetical protein